jgi:hypothetical protein
MIFDRDIYLVHLVICFKVRRIAFRKYPFKPPVVEFLTIKLTQTSTSLERKQPNSEDDI